MFLLLLRWWIIVLMPLWIRKSTGNHIPKRDSRETLESRWLSSSAWLHNCICVYSHTMNWSTLSLCCWVSQSVISLTTLTTSSPVLSLLVSEQTEESGPEPPRCSLYPTFFNRQRVNTLPAGSIYQSTFLSQCTSPSAGVFSLPVSDQRRQAGAIMAIFGWHQTRKWMISFSCQFFGGDLV